MNKMPVSIFEVYTYVVNTAVGGIDVPCTPRCPWQPRVGSHGCEAQTSSSTTLLVVIHGYEFFHFNRGTHTLEKGPRLENNRPKHTCILDPLLTICLVVRKKL